MRSHVAIVTVIVLVWSPSLAACRAPGPEAVASRELATVEQAETIEGRDGGLSTLVWDRSVWVYGDTVLTVEDEWGRTWHHNSFSLTEDLDARDGISGFVEPLDPAGAPLHLIPPTPEEKQFNEAHWAEGPDGTCDEQPCGARWAVWPGNPIWDPTREQALIFYGLIYAEPGDFNFESVGASIAVWSDPEQLPVRPIIDPEAEHPDLLWRAGEPGWGVGSNILDDQLHTFACDGADGPKHACRLARVELERVHERAAWRYWTGERWSPDMDEVEVLFEGAPIMSVDFNEFLGEWLAVYSPPFSEKILARSAPALTGPWSREGVLHDAGEDTPYDAVAHAEYAREGGRILYVSYSRPTSGWFGAEFALVEIEL